MTIQAGQHNIKDIFSLKDYQFEIPSYQRPYAWTGEQASELINDIIDAFPYGESEPQEYFLGSIVIIKKNPNQPHADVIDGQQRLTSLSLLFAVFRYLLPSEMNEQKEYITGLLEQKDPIINKKIVGLQLRKQDRKFFDQQVISQEGMAILLAKNSGFDTDSQVLLRDNAKIFIKNIKEKCPKDINLSDWILHLVSHIRDYCFLVVVSTQNFDTAYRIFSTLNTRGLDLFPCDIIKSRVLGAIRDPQKQAEYSAIWEQEEKDLGRDDFNMLFTHIHRIKRREKARKSIVSEYETHIKPEDSPEKFIDEDLKPYSDKFEIINQCSFNAEDEDLQKKINQLFAWLGRIDNSDWIPPALYFLVKYPHKAEDIYRFFKALERLAASLMILRRNINERIQTYKRVIEGIDHGVESAITAAIQAINDTEQQDIVNILDGDLYLVSQIRKYVLLRLDAELDKSCERKFDEKQIITIEHVLPQNPQKGSWSHWSDADIHRQWVHRLGNLVLLSKKKNSEAQNFSFQEKKEKYFSSQKPKKAEESSKKFEDSETTTFALTVRVLNTAEWTVDVVDKNQKEYLGKLKQLWNL